MFAPWGIIAECALTKWHLLRRGGSQGHHLEECISLPGSSLHAQLPGYHDTSSFPQLNLSSVFLLHRSQLTMNRILLKAWAKIKHLNCEYFAPVIRKWLKHMVSGNFIQIVWLQGRNFIAKWDSRAKIFNLWRWGNRPGEQCQRKRDMRSNIPPKMMPLWPTRYI